MNREHLVVAAWKKGLPDQKDNQTSGRKDFSTRCSDVRLDPS